MKILCISDQIDPLVYSANIKKRYGDVDLVISAGDLPMEYLEFVVSGLNKPLLFVFGNHNLEAFSYYHPASSKTDTIPFHKGYGSTYIGFTSHKESSLLFAGASGCLRYNNGESQYTERQMKWKLIMMIPRLLYNKIRYGRYLDVFVAHAAPFGINDKEDVCHRGFKCFRWFINTFKPRYFLHGHIHLYDLQDTRVTRYGDTTVINVFSNYILEIPADPAATN